MQAKAVGFLYRTRRSYISRRSANSSGKTVTTTCLCSAMLQLYRCTKGALVSQVGAQNAVDISVTVGQVDGGASSECTCVRAV